MANELQRRYPGLNYFKETQRAQFFGRDDEIEELHALILTEKIVTLFGKSGYGKSSLLRAGILPLLGPEVVPLLVQFGAYQPGISPTPVERVLTQLDIALLDNYPDSAFLEDISASDTLWHRFKRKQNPAHKQFLLVFDQFEEFDSYPAPQRTDFKQQLAELLFTRIPQAVRDRSDTLPDEQQTLLARPLEVKTVFAIREDRLSVLDSLADKLPAILYKRFKLQGLSEKQAVRAIEGPAALPQSDGFVSPAFSYTPEAIQAILAGLEKKSASLQPDSDGNALASGNKNSRVEAFLLQICCENIESSVLQRAGHGEQHIRIVPADLPPFERLFEAYYRGKIAALPTEEQQSAARRMIEDELVKTDPLTGIAYRLNADGRRLRSLPGMSEALLKRLTDDFLLRSEPNTTGDFNYEVSHDTLVEGILKSKNEYESAKAQAAAEQAAREEAERLRQEAIEREKQLAEAEKQRALETARAEAAERLKNEALEAKKEAEQAKAAAEQGRKRARTFAYLAGWVAAAAIGVGVFAFFQKRKADEATATAKTETENAKTNLRRMEAANAARLKIEIGKYLTAAERMRKLGDDDMAREILLEAQKLDSLKQNRAVDSLLNQLK
jgi:hypothetical protein